VRREELSLLPQFRQLAFDAVKIILHVLALICRFHCAAVVEDHAVDFEHLRVVLDFLGVLEERAHHPGVSEDSLEPLHRFFCRHGLASGEDEAAATAVGLAAALPDSASSLENRTNAAPTPTRMMPSHSFQPGNSTAK